MDIKMNPYGMMPNQVDGTINGVQFYFRARHGSWALHVGEPIFKHPPIAEGDDPNAGWWDIDTLIAVTRAVIKTALYNEKDFGLKEKQVC